jgi:hypothetical protein
MMPGLVFDVLLPLMAKGENLLYESDQVKRRAGPMRLDTLVFYTNIYTRVSYSGVGGEGGCTEREMS